MGASNAGNVGGTGRWCNDGSGNGVCVLGGTTLYGVQ